MITWQEDVKSAEKERFQVRLYRAKDRLIWRKRLTECYRATGDWTIYALPPSIILPGLDSIDGFIDIGDGIFLHSGITEGVSTGSVLRIRDPRLLPLSEEAGLFVSRDRGLDFFFGEGKVKADQAVLFEFDGYITRIIKRRPLRLSLPAEP